MKLIKPHHRFEQLLDYQVALQTSGSGGTYLI